MRKKYIGHFGRGMIIQDSIDDHLGGVPGSSIVRFDRNIECYRVVFCGVLQRPTFNSKGAASAFLTGLQNGTRKQEPVGS